MSKRKWLEEKKRREQESNITAVRKADEEHALMLGGDTTNTTLYPRRQRGSRTRAREWPAEMRYVVDSHGGAVELNSTEPVVRHTRV